MRGLRATAAVLTCVAVMGSGGCSPRSSDDGAPASLTDAPVRVLAAASLTDAFQTMIDSFTAEHPEVEFAPLVTGGSQKLVQQVNEGAPADVLALAGEENLKALTAPAADADFRIFATNTLVIVTPKGNPKHISGLSDLAADDVRVAVCVRQAPCGRATGKLLDTYGIAVHRPTEENNVRATLAKAEIGEVDAAVVYRSDALGNDAVDTVVVAEAADIVNRYPIAALSDSDAAEQFVDYVVSDKGQKILADKGLGGPVR
ncbi:molybdate ABC transporter substrate-binding protein [Corynebacterium mendelii]|uniref:Molybdate ABC transporter substrate-binding protein n=1 Tax=Corynebacterium mendelii TaxID=2765362 RepID=A0A939IX95_9CORY|nr:molybdate ABC transporter substrate-binding protein [Corynebacterium mendelii]MBN9643838.1 molybdate ABC transporter substrate-binding protein [Corynebacterium mendelii]